ncbi:hypothetical protein B0H16DRAFT_1302521 [Mycena metata]|uniref:Reverse transcriptase zinc-binding domain-containing protein n=1 Tax=Mycena metata TaxID=1033252 RepID=A0AAD7K3N0_9AGAR|nr:hypothetical protein B0H16DRAFT_1302521 [Mycena metata]
MFELPGIRLKSGSQRIFTKAIKAMRPKPYRRSTFVNLDRTRSAIESISGYTPTDATIWNSLRSTTLQRLTREFLWKCVHNTFRVGDFWGHIDTKELYGPCHFCDAPETLEHIALGCEAHGQKVIWNLTRELWLKKYNDWPNLSWGLILGCNLVRFTAICGT